MAAFVKPVNCRRCRGTGLYGGPGGQIGPHGPRVCWGCGGSGLVEGDKATIAAGRAKADRHRAAYKALEASQVGKSWQERHAATDQFRRVEDDAYTTGDWSAYDATVARLLGEGVAA